jgi:hypothetical protein
LKKIIVHAVPHMVNFPTSYLEIDGFQVACSVALRPWLHHLLDTVSTAASVLLVAITLWSGNSRRHMWCHPSLLAQLVPAPMANHNRSSCFGCPLLVRGWPHQVTSPCLQLILVLWLQSQPPCLHEFRLFQFFLDIFRILVPNFQFRVKKTQNVMCRIGCVQCLLLVEEQVQIVLK